MRNTFFLPMMLVGLIYFGFFGVISAADPDALLRSIEEKSKALLQVNSQIQETQKNLQETENKGKSLNQEIKKIDYQLNQLDLSIKSSQLKIEKLGLEIESLAYGISEKEEEIFSKKETIAGFLRELQEKSHENTLVIFLKNQSLADSIFETQSLNTLSDNLNQEIGKLQNIKGDLADKLSQSSLRRNAVETETKTLKSRKSITEEQKGERQSLIKETKNQEKLYQEQLKTLEKQQAEIASEIEAVEKELRDKINPNLLPLPRPGVLEWPVALGRISQGYGRTSFAIVTYKGKYHNGVDFAAPIGTEIYAGEDGEIAASGNQDLYCPRAGYGKYIVIKHDNGLTTLYGHLSKLIVVNGQKVLRGQLIGYMGRSGWATGSHLHFTVWSTATYLIRATKVCGPMPVGGDLDPMQYLDVSKAL